MIVDEDTDEEKSYTIVGHYEANADNGMISLNAPIARAFIGKSVGDSVEVRTPQGLKTYEILDVEYSA